MYDIAIIGGGPVGLAFALSLAGFGLRLALIEKQPEQALADPSFDGREIALTHHSRSVMERLGAWDRLPEGAVSPLNRARVLNGRGPQGLAFTAPPAVAGQPLGFLVPNHLIRRSLYSRFAEEAPADLIAGVALDRFSIDEEGAKLHLSDGQEIAARLLIAADTRFSATRTAAGIGAIRHDFKRSMLVCRMAHEAPHHETATEWFAYGQTVALLPVNGGISSVVITRGAEEIAALMAMDAPAFEAEMARSLARRHLGTLKLVSTRHAYPLVATYARRFTANRFALIGDAAVGMHPMTAHGFNLGLSGAALLAEGIRAAGDDFAAARTLRRYEAAHRRASFPLFAGTNAIATLYSKESAPALVARHAVIGLGAALPPARRLISAMLTDRRERPAAA
jgi:ubiquinone biosynthesis UbiH/UbiF/VisC/COQ6 family hydroxylase